VSRTLLRRIAAVEDLAVKSHEVHDLTATRFDVAEVVVSGSLELPAGRGDHEISPTT
jgi:hypothetical protein